MKNYIFTFSVLAFKNIIRRKIISLFIITIIIFFSLIIFFFGYFYFGVQYIPAFQKYLSLLEDLSGLAKIFFSLFLISFGAAFSGFFFTEFRNREIEIGILRSMGARKIDIVKMIFLEAFYLSFIGSIIGALINFIGVFVIFRELFRPFTFGKFLHDLIFFSALGSASILGVVIFVCLGIVYTAFYASGLDPYHILRRGK
ncbi:MAG: ABC transporter permease [Actinomycetia bacterium]|nr:ABC transporter permease [Actinomycetes bacterium]